MQHFTGRDVYTRNQVVAWIEEELVATVNAVLTVGLSHACFQNAPGRLPPRLKRNPSSTQGPTVRKARSVATRLSGRSALLACCEGGGHRDPDPGKDGSGCWLSSRASIIAASSSFRFSPIRESCKAFLAPIKSQLRSSWVCRNCSVAVCHD